MFDDEAWRVILGGSVCLLLAGCTSAEAWADCTGIGWACDPSGVSLECEAGQWMPRDPCGDTCEEIGDNRIHCCPTDIVLCVSADPHFCDLKCFETKPDGTKHLTEN
ncbi:MAG: hypothetical protein HYV07_34240 [Deltaproteobacteria bacterium]|nr:hypothetical protein [Deltaproteobacteria bacterium]